MENASTEEKSLYDLLMEGRAHRAENGFSVWDVAWRALNDTLILPCDVAAALFLLQREHPATIDRFMDDWERLRGPERKRVAHEHAQVCFLQLCNDDELPTDAREQLETLEQLDSKTHEPSLFRVPHERAAELLKEFGSIPADTSVLCICGCGLEVTRGEVGKMGEPSVAMLWMRSYEKARSGEDPATEPIDSVVSSLLDAILRGRNN